MDEEEKRQHWLLKTEPNCWSWENQEANSGLSVWDGVRNQQAQNLMKSMNTGDLCLFYHTGKLKEVAGIVRVVRTFYPDPTDGSGKWGAVDVQEVKAFNRPVTLGQMKDDDHFKDFKMLRQPRLSVVPVDQNVWDRVCELGEAESAESHGVQEMEKNGGHVKKVGKEQAEKLEIQTTKRGAKASRKKGEGSDVKEVLLVHTTDTNGRDEKKQAEAATRKRGTSQVPASSMKATPRGRQEKRVSKTQVPAAPSITPRKRNKKGL